MKKSLLAGSCILVAGTIVFFYLIRSIYNDLPAGIISPVARPPMNPWDIPLVGQMMWSYMYSVLGNLARSEGWLGFTGWYMLCSFTTSSFLQKIFKVNPTGGQSGAPSLFDSSAQIELPKPESL